MFSIVVFLAPQVHNHSQSYEETAGALQQQLPDLLTAALPQQLLHLSSACVMGCVQMFVWVTQLSKPLAAPDRPGAVSMGQDSSGHLVSVGGRSDDQQGPDKQAAAALSLHDELASAARAAGAEGSVDIQLTTQAAPHRYNLGMSLPGEDGSISPATPDRHSTSSTPSANVVLQGLSPPCLALSEQHLSGQQPSLGPALTVGLHLTSPEAQQCVRVLLLLAATGAVLVDEEQQVGAGAVGSISLSLSADLVARAAASTAPAHRQQHSGSGTSMQAIIPLRLVITTPAHPHSTTTQLPQVTHLLATATLLAAPVSLASELCSLYSMEEQEGPEAGLSPQDVWSHHWQPLMDDLCLLSTLAGGAAETGLGHQQAASTVTEVATSLHHLFCLNNLPAWQEEVARVLDTLLQEQQQQAQVATAAHPGSRVSSSGQEVISATSTKTSSNAGTSSSSNEKPPTTAQRPAPAPAQPQHMASARPYSSRVYRYLQLLLGGFPGAGEERVWQSDISVTSVKALDPWGVVLQIAMAGVAMARMWQEGLLDRWSLNWLLYICYTTPWLWALLRCVAWDAMQGRSCLRPFDDTSVLSIIAAAWHAREWKVMRQQVQCTIHCPEQLADLVPLLLCMCCLAAAGTLRAGSHVPGLSCWLPGTMYSSLQPCMQACCRAQPICSGCP
jgi:hypothetical protein